MKINLTKYTAVLQQLFEKSENTNFEKFVRDYVLAAVEEKLNGKA